MKQVSNSKCPKCGSEDFITQLNRYDCLKFVSGEFQAEKSEFVNEKERVFCRECSNEIDVKTSFRHGKVILRIAR